MKWVSHWCTNAQFVSGINKVITSREKKIHRQCLDILQQWHLKAACVQGPKPWGDILSVANISAISKNACLVPLGITENLCSSRRRKWSKGI